MQALKNELITRDEKSHIEYWEVFMEKYFLGNNSGYGFWNEYDNELKSKDRVLLLKGGAGTGKSTLMKKIAQKALAMGCDCELWYCSGDPQSLDGVYIKEFDRAIVDATAPHASGVDIPIVKDKIIDLAEGLNADKLKGERANIQNLIKRKKAYFMRVYQHLKCALCHFHNQLDIEKQGVSESGIRAYAAMFARDLKSKAEGGRIRKLFSSAICPSGESVFYEHFKDKVVMLVEGCDYARAVFFDELKKNIDKCTLFLNPLEPNIVDGITAGDVAITSDCGGAVANSTHIDLSVYGETSDKEGATEEKNGAITQIAFARDRLNKARETHMEIEKVFVQALDFSRNEEMTKKAEEFLFEK